VALYAPMDGLVTVAALQLDYKPRETRAMRIDRVLQELDRAPSADLIVLPELWDVGYFAFDDYMREAQPIEEGPALGLANVAASRGCTIVGTVLERDNERLHNTTVVVGPHGIAGTYRKHRLFRHESREGELLSPGSTGPAVVETTVGLLGLATCFELRFPEHFATLRQNAADIFVVPAAWPLARLLHWRTLVQARAIEGQTPVVAVNGTGLCVDVELAGCSLIVDARGAVLAHAGRSPGWLTAFIDRADTRAWRTDFPMYEDGPTKARDAFRGVDIGTPNDEPLAKPSRPDDER